MADNITVKNLCLHGKHGVLPEETSLGQKFYLDIDCSLDVAPGAADDEYAAAVCYETLCGIAARMSEAGPYRLIETLGDRVASAVLSQFDAIAEVEVRVRKPSAPIAAMLDHVEVTIRRSRS